ncbi:MAG: AhpC/TSA family protein, partial [Saprospiraceae bacterium]|nr:AhpC/TSA family protein [Saprospiraceae bacterium]
MRFRAYLLLLISAIVFIQCDTASPGLTISGNVENAKDLTAYLDYKSLDNAIQPIANVAVEGNGSFSFNYPEGLKPGIYRVRIGTQSADLILTGNEKQIKLEGDINNFKTYDYSITGSELSETYRQKVSDLINRKISSEEVNAFMKSDIDPLLAATLSLATAPPNPANHANYTFVSDKLKAAYADTEIANSYANFASMMSKQFKMQQSKYKVQIGQPAPDIAMTDVKGQVKRLSDLKGKVVLLDFWASWCGPCRRANPHVVETYHKYKDQGFTVFSVSLDGLDARTKQRFPADQLDAQLKKQKQRWIDAIAKDKLEWDTHVSDLKKWECAPAKAYGVSSIPRTFMIDKEGRIAAMNLRGEQVEEVLL